MEPQVLEKKIVLLFTQRKIVIISSQLNLNTLRQISRNQKVISDCAISKREKGQLSSDLFMFLHSHGITAPKTTREGQESTTKTNLHLA